MHRRVVPVFVVTVSLAGLLSALAVAGAVGQETERRQRVVGPRAPSDAGAGELLIVVSGGVYATREQADAAAAAMAFGDVQGYYVVPVAQFQGFREQVGTPGQFALVTTFRTQEGADEFVLLARAFGYPATVLPQRVRSLGGLYAGLGQEANPDGSGPLLGPIEESLP